MIGVTGATGQLGQLVIEGLRKAVGDDGFVALARRPEALSGGGYAVRAAAYSDAAALEAALDGVDRLLLISSSEVGQRAVQHQAVIDAAKAAGVDHIVYTSILNADTSPLGLAVEHVATEKALAASGIAHTILRNGWYSENYANAIQQAAQSGTFHGAAGNGRVASASRADFAAAAVAVLAGEGHEGKVYELAGDADYTYSELAAMIATVAGKPVAYQDLPQAAYAEALEKAGLPKPFAELLADSDAGAAKGGLASASRDLSRLIGRPSTPMSATVAAILG